MIWEKDIDLMNIWGFENSIFTLLEKIQKDTFEIIPQDTYSVFVLHDGRAAENYPIFNALPFYSIMGDTSTLNSKDLSNINRKTTFRDDLGNNIKDDVYEYSEFTSLYSLWKNGFASSHLYIGIMHYRSYLNLFDRSDFMNLCSQDDYHKVINHLAIAKKPFQSNERSGFNKIHPSKDYVYRMGYDKENLNELLVNHKVDILTSTPDGNDVPFNLSLTEQFVAAHGICKDNQNNDANLEKLIAITGWLVQEYNENISRNKKSYLREINCESIDLEYLRSRTSNIKGAEEFLRLGNNNNKNRRISLEWLKYMGFLEYYNRKYHLTTDSKYLKLPPVTFFKDLFIFHRNVYSQYMEFIIPILNQLKNGCGKEIVDDIKAKSKDGGSRILAFLGERITGYFIYEMMRVGKRSNQVDVTVASIARAHYGDGKELSDFLFDLYPKYEVKVVNELGSTKSVTLIPLFEFQKNGGKDHREVVSTRYETKRNSMNSIYLDKYYFVRCIGYIAGEKVSEKSRGICKTKDGDNEKLRFLPPNYFPEENEFLGYELNAGIEKAKFVYKVELSDEDEIEEQSIKLYPYEFTLFTKSQSGINEEERLISKFDFVPEYFSKSKTDFKVNLVTFNRSDIIKGI